MAYNMGETRGPDAEHIQPGMEGHFGEPRIRGELVRWASLGLEGLKAGCTHSLGVRVLGATDVDAGQR